MPAELENKSPDQIYIYVVIVVKLHAGGHCHSGLPSVGGLYRLLHQLAGAAADDAALGPRRIVGWRGRSLAEAPLALLRLKVGRHAQRQAEAAEELLRG